MQVAEIVGRKPYVCKAFVKLEPTRQSGSHATAKPTRAFTFDMTKAEEIFDSLLADKMFTFSFGPKFSLQDDIENKEYCKYYNFWNHSTINCMVSRNNILDRIQKGEFKFPKKAKSAMGVDSNTFTIGLSMNMVAINTNNMPNSAPKCRIILGATC